MEHKRAVLRPISQLLISASILLFAGVGHAQNGPNTPDQVCKMVLSRMQGNGSVQSKDVAHHFNQCQSLEDGCKSLHQQSKQICGVNGSWERDQSYNWTAIQNMASGGGVSANAQALRNGCRQAIFRRGLQIDSCRKAIAQCKKQNYKIKYEGGEQNILCDFFNTTDQSTGKLGNDTYCRDLEKDLQELNQRRFNEQQTCDNITQTIQEVTTPSNQ